MSHFKTIVSAILILLAGGIIRLWIIQNRTINTLQNLQKLTISSPAPIATSESSTLEETQPATNSTLTVLEKANSSLQTSVSNLLNRIEVLEENTTTPGIGGPTTITPAFQPQTFYLGSTTNNHHEWIDVGLEVTINTANYPSNISAVFEAGIALPGGEGWARLRNKTNGAVLSITEVFHNNDTTTWKSSPSFKLHSGNNTYVVQLKSTSHETLTLSGARIKISQ
ncbi:hypothetical protein ACFL18_02500 [Patescibacteria group bacterium]